MRAEARSSLRPQAQQQGVRKIVAGGGGAGSLQDQAAGYRQDIKRLEAQLTHMVAAHAGLIRAVQMAGGGPALERFWRDYKAVGDAVQPFSSQRRASSNASALARRQDVRRNGRLTGRSRPAWVDFAANPQCVRTTKPPLIRVANPPPNRAVATAMSADVAEES